MPDISLCSNTKCPLRYRCGRYLCKPDAHWQSYSGFQPIANQCDGFWDVQDFPYKHLLENCKPADERNARFEEALKEQSEDGE